MALFIDRPRAQDQFKTLQRFGATAQGVQTRIRERDLLPGVAPTAANEGKPRKFWPTDVVRAAAFGALPPPADRLKPFWSAWSLG
jgi:hypothetical protein